MPAHGFQHDQFEGTRVRDPTGRVNNANRDPRLRSGGHAGRSAEAFVNDRQPGDGLPPPHQAFPNLLALSPAIAGLA